MKKYSIFLIALLSLSACKKENQTSTTNTLTDSLAPKGTAMDSTAVLGGVAAGPAISEKDGVYTQNFNLTVGETYPLTTYQRNLQSVVGPDGKTQKASSNSTDEMSFTVNDFKDGIYDLTINLIGKTNSQTVDGKTISVDTKGKEPQDPQLKMMWHMNRALTGNKLQMKMNSKGDVLSITGFDPIYKKITTAATTLIKDEGQKQEFLKGFKASFNENTIKEQFTKNLMVLPKAGAKMGQKWSETENASQDGSVKLTTHYTLEKVDNGIVTIKVTGGIPKKSDKKTNEGVTNTISSELSQSGSVKLDQATGWIKNQNVSIKSTQSQTLSDGKQSETMKSESTSTIIVNPEK